MRRVGTNDSTPPPMPPRALQEEEEPEEEDEEGEWAEALYEYSSEVGELLFYHFHFCPKDTLRHQDPGDLQLEAHQVADHLPARDLHSSVQSIEVQSTREGIC